MVTTMTVEQTGSACRCGFCSSAPQPVAVTAPPIGGAVEAPGDGLVLEAAGITKSFRRGIGPRRKALPVLRGADLILRGGEIVGLVGENGSGKSTMMKILSGALPRDGGEVRRLGEIGYCPQDPILYERLTCDEHFELFGRAYGMGRGSVEEARSAIYETLGFGSWAGARVEELSGGTRAKLNLGLALLADPEVLLLDEPYAGFDWETYQRFWKLAAERKAEGRAVLIISHFVTDEDRFDRIYHMEDGRSVER
jgi:ABC-2 type transport system ATP-binding protein